MLQVRIYLLNPPTISTKLKLHEISSEPSYSGSHKIFRYKTTMDTAVTKKTNACFLDWKTAMKVLWKDSILTFHTELKL